MYQQRTNITISADEIKKLIKSSNEVRDKLLEGSADDEFYIEEKIVEETTITPEVKQIKCFNDCLSSLQTEIVDFIEMMGGCVSETELNDKFKGCFIQMEIDTINEAAIDFFGDMLFVFEDGCYIKQEF